MAWTAAFYERYQRGRKRNGSTLATYSGPYANGYADGLRHAITELDKLLTDMGSRCTKNCRGMVEITRNSFINEIEGKDVLNGEGQEEV